MAQQYKIPQNLDIEDKILGPFTLKQFLYMIGGAVTIYILFNVFAKTNFMLFIVMSIPIAMFTFALTFVKINERPFVDFFFYFGQYLRDVRQKKWVKSTKIKTFDVTVKISEDEISKQKEMAKLAKRGIVQSQLSQMATLLDTRGWNQGDVGAGNALAGRVISSNEEKSIASGLVREDENLEDIFSDIEGAVEKLKVGVEEDKYSDLADRIKGIIG